MNFERTCVRDAETGLEQWQALLVAIRRGDPDASSEFARVYGPGVRFLYRRGLSAVAAERLAGDVVAGAIEEIRRGWISDPHDLQKYVADMLAIYRDKTPDNPGPAPSARARRDLAWMEAALAAMSEAERSAMRILFDGAPLHEVAERTGIPEAKVRALRDRLAAAIEPAPEKKPPRRETVVFKAARRASA